MIRGLDLHVLQIFDMVMRCRNVTKAGEQLNLSQPAVSAGLARLRHAFSDPLFTRRRTEMIPTSLALAISPSVTALLQQFEQVAALASPFDPSSARRTFRIMGADYFSTLVWPGLTRRLAAEAPHCVLHALDNSRLTLAEAFKTELVDVALDYAHPMPEGLRSLPICDEHLICIAGGAHPVISALGLPGGAPMPLDTFCSLPHVMRSSFGTALGRIDVALKAVGRSRRVAATSSHFWAVIQMVAESGHIASIPSKLLPLAQRAFAINAYQLPIEIGPQDHTLALIWDAEVQDNKAGAWLRDVVLQQARHLLMDASVAKQALHNVR